MTDFVGRTLGRYEVVSLLGAGGMGEVYRARDTELERDVAVKVLPEVAADDPERLERFAREARAVARLSHPNILEIFDVGHDDGLQYVVTELLEGLTLREHLERGRFPVRKAIAVIDAVARGLGAAHAHGVIHRDIKPENVLLTSDGRVKVLDFGVARLHPYPPRTQVSSDSELTAPQAIVGTAGYMAPEQIRGDPVDARSDVFALGCVLYELLTGRRAFHGATPVDTMADILHADPPAPASLVPEIPTGIDRVVMRCLEKEPAERFESARDVAFALRAVDHGLLTPVPGTAAPRRPRARRILVLAGAAVLAVVAMGLWVLRDRGPQEQRPEPLPSEIRLAVARFEAVEPSSAEARYTAAGIGESLAADVLLLEAQQHGSMWVLPGSSPATLAAADVTEAVHDNGLTLMLEGSVSTLAGTLRLDLSLVEPTGARVLRRTVVDEDPPNPAACRRQALSQVAAMLGLVVESDTLEVLRRSGTTVAAARDAFLLGLGALAADPPELDLATRELERSVAADPGFASAWVALSRARLGEASRDPGMNLDGALEAARQAVSVGWDPRGAELALAGVLAAAGRPDEAVEALEVAVRSQPRNAEARLRLGVAYLEAGRLEEAEAALQRSVYLRPSYWVAHHWLGRLDMARDRDEEAAVHWQRVVELVPENPKAHTNLGAIFDRLDRPDDARRMYERSLELMPTGNVKALSNLGKLYYDMARFDDAARLYERVVLEQPEVSRYWGYLGFACRWSDRTERSVEAFRRATELGRPELDRDPPDADELARLAGYHAILGERDAAVALLERAEATAPRGATTCALLAEGWETAGDRARALVWVRHALAAGASPRRFETDPEMRGLAADPDYRRLLRDRTSALDRAKGD